MSWHIERYGSGTPLLLIHGWGMHGGMWGELVPALAQQYCVHVVDLPGHGYSHGIQDSGFRIQEPGFADADVDSSTCPALDRIVDGLAAQFTGPLNVCGWSLGGQIALRWARRQPQQVNRLVVLASTPCFVRRADWPWAMAAETLAGFAADLQQHYAQTLRRFLALQVRGSERERELLGELRTALFSRGEPDADALQAGLEILRSCDLRAELAAIKQPMLVIAGERDALTPPEAARYLAAHAGQAQLALIRGAAHAPFLSHPAEVVAQIRRFLDE